MGFEYRDQRRCGGHLCQDMPELTNQPLRQTCHETSLTEGNIHSLHPFIPPSLLLANTDRYHLLLDTCCPTDLSLCLFLSLS